MKIYKKRDGKKYHQWREEVFKRDDYTCKKCGEKDKKLHPHHIIKWDDDPTLRLDVNNGLTLCTSCHNKEHHLGRIAWNKGISPTEEQRKKMSLAKLGKPSKKKGIKTGISWNRGKKTGIGGPKGQKFSEEHRTKLSAAKKGKASWNKGIPMKESTKEIFKEKFKGKKWIIDPESGKRKWID